MSSTSLIERARNYVAKMPAAVSGSGGHDATFKVACVLLQGFDLARQDARGILDEFNARCQPPWSDREIEHKLNQADKMSGLETRDGLQPRGCLAREIERSDGPREAVPPSKAASAPLPPDPGFKPEFKADKLRAFAQRWRGLVDTAWLADRSPVAPCTLGVGLSPDDYLKHVFRDGEKVVVFTNQQSQGQAMWPLQRVPERGDEGVWYLSQPVDGLEYVNPRAGKKDGFPKMSRRSAESVTDWRHLVLENDESDSRDWIAALIQIPLHVVAIYTSGGRSIHALVAVNAKSEGDWDQLVSQVRPVFVTLGADRRAMSAVRLTRLPGCWRGDRLQKLLFLNPTPTGGPICAMPRVRDVLGDSLGVAENFLKFTPADVHGWDSWDDVERCERVFEWFAMSAAANEMLQRIRKWKEGVGE